MSIDFRPLADRVRPATIEEIIGQEHILGPGKALRTALDSGTAHSMVLWGPPGTGKTTLARLVAARLDADMITLSAVLAGVKDIRAAVETARAQLSRRRTIVFVDEVHRFNKAQQDAFLPHIEDGTITFIGATTENPAFELNNALLSRLRVYVLKSLTPEALQLVLDRALAQVQGDEAYELEAGAERVLIDFADGDARRLLNMLEICAGVETRNVIRLETVTEVVAGGSYRRFDKGGDEFYDQISALHKSVRGSDPDASLYWFARMLDGGCDPLYIARRLVRIASEDVGNADPRALRLALDAWDVYQRLGSPEGELAIAQCAVYLACAPKSNATYAAFNEVTADVAAHGTEPVPAHLRNAPTQLAKQLGHGAQYRYDHAEKDGYAGGQRYFPDGMTARTYYRPVARGLELKIAEKLERLRGKPGAAQDPAAARD